MTMTGHGVTVGEDEHRALARAFGLLSMHHQLEARGRWPRWGMIWTGNQAEGWIGVLGSATILATTGRNATQLWSVLTECTLLAMRAVRGSIETGTGFDERGDAGTWGTQRAGLVGVSGGSLNPAATARNLSPLRPGCLAGTALSGGRLDLGTSEDWVRL